MTSKQQKIILALIMLLAGTLLFVMASTSRTQAQGTVQPTATNIGGGTAGGGDDDGGGLLLAYIELFVSPTPVGVESVVQWQDVNGDWNDVEGWKRELQNGYERWTVEAKDFNSGPFRWAVRNGQSGVVLGSSESFTLPAGGNQTTQVTITLE